MRKVTILILTALALLAMTALIINAEEAKNDYVGESKCKTCHKDNHASWSQTKHANAYNLLSDEEKKNEKCVGCHITGTTAEGVLLEGVQCEACHGAGSAFKSAKIMSKKKWEADPEGQKKMAIEAGLIYPTEKTCRKCHSGEKGDKDGTFNFEKSKGKVHPAAAK